MKNNFIISYGDSVLNNQVKRANFSDLVESLTTDQIISNIVSDVRAIADKPDRQEFKRANLPYFNLGLFKDNIRRGEQLDSIQFMVVDLDGLSAEQMIEVKNTLENDSKVFMYFISPSGNGYKVVYKFCEPIIEDYEKYSKNYEYYVKKIWSKYVNVIDEKTKDVARACYFSYDPNLYLNENAETLIVKEFVESIAEEVTTAKIDLTKVKTDEEMFIPEAVKFLSNKINNYDDWRSAGMALASLGEKGRSYFQELSSNPRYKDTAKKVDKKFDNFLQKATGKIKIATLFEIAKNYGFTYSAPKQPNITPIINVASFVNEMKDQFNHDDNRVIGELIGYKLNKFSEIAQNLDGVQPGFYHLAADTNIGKTAYYTNLAIDMLNSNDDLTVLFFALDDSKKYAAYRYLSILSELKFKDVKYGLKNLKDPVDRTALTYAREKFLEYVEDERLLIYDISDIQHIDQVEDVIKNYNSKNIVVIIDGLYNLEVSDGSKEGIRQENIERAQKVKKLVDVYNLPIFTTGEFRKKQKSEGENKKPVIDDLMETGKFAYNANVVWLLYPDDYKMKNDPEVKLKLEYAKNKISEFKGIQELTFIRGKGKIEQGWSKFSYAPTNTKDENKKGLQLSDLITLGGGEFE
ncbi:MAG: DnaB-like helicase C-terminal domain-containing protein [Melioribacteraceae bacterium]